MGVYAVVVGVGFIAAFPSVGQAMLRFGWRGTWAGIGWVLVLILTPLAWSLVRDQPEDQGLGLDGDDAGQKSHLSDYTLREALHSPAFWVFSLSSSVFGLVYSGIALFNESILAEPGFDASPYHAVLPISAFFGLLP